MDFRPPNLSETDCTLAAPRIFGVYTLLRTLVLAPMCSAPMARKRIRVYNTRSSGLLKCFAPRCDTSACF